MINSNSVEEFVKYLSSLWPFLPLLFFTIAIVFRLMDNSAYLFLKKDILINSSNVSRKLLKRYISFDEDPEFKKQLKRALLYRNLQQSFLFFAVISLPLSVVFYYLG